LSFAYIFTSFSYLFTLIFGYYLFHESIKVNNIVGVVIIIFGIGITLMKEKKDDC
ncbi:MAG: EamA family transporter, partial [Fusobacteria bacterium]|nr:EamA family transporter [Fusobacteriota bacterium]